MIGGASTSSSSGEEDRSQLQEPQKITVSWTPGGQEDTPGLGLGLQLRDFPLSTPTLLDPLEVRFSQMKMRHLFGDGRRVSDAVHQLNLVPASEEVKRDTGADWRIVAPFPMIEVLWWRCKVRDETTGKPKTDPNTKEDLYDSEEHWFTLDNRRLYCLQEVAMRVWPQRAVCDVAVIVGGPHKHMRELRKFRTLDKGKSIAIGSRADQVSFVRWCWEAKAGVEEWKKGDDEYLELRAEGMLIERRPKVDILQMLSAVEPDSDERIQLSKHLSFLLRRGSGTSGVKAEPDGWIKLETLLKPGSDQISALPGMTLERLLTLIEESNRQKFRYEVKDDPKRGKLIRASGKKAGQQPVPVPSAKPEAPRAPPPGNWNPPASQTPAAQATPRSGPFAPPGILTSPIDLSSPPGLPATPGVAVAAMASAQAPYNKAAAAAPNRGPTGSVIRGPVAPGVVKAPAVPTSKAKPSPELNGGGGGGEKGPAKAKGQASPPAEKKIPKVSSKTIRAQPLLPLLPPTNFGKGGMGHSYPPGMQFGMRPPHIPPHLAAVKGKGKGPELAKLVYQMHMQETVARMAALENLKMQAAWEMMAESYAAEEASTADWSCSGGLEWDEQDHYNYDAASFDQASGGDSLGHGWEDMDEWGNSMSSRTAQTEEVSMEEKVRRNLEAARVRAAVRVAVQESLEHHQKKKADPRAVDSTSLESKAAEALTAARMRSWGSGTGTHGPPGQNAAAPDRPPGIAHPAERDVDIQATVQEALQAAKVRQARPSA